jgi:RNA polymerase sigma-70 factor (ECF subfamily)
VDEVTGWALRARDGDPVAEAALVRAVQAEVWRFCASLVDPGAADDLTQETFLRVFRALPGFEGRASARTWLLGIARRTCADHLRGVVRRRRLEDVLRRAAGEGTDRSRATHRTAEATAPDPAAAATADDLLARLPADRRAAFALTQLVGLSYQEAAEVEGVPVGTIRSRVARARDDLIAQLERVAAS